MELNVTIHDHWFVGDVLSGKSAPIPYNGKDVTLFWSGGVDSTYMLFWLLANGYGVHTVYCEIKNNSFKVKRENWARKKIRNWVLGNVPSLADNWKHTESPLSVVYIPDGGSRAALAQAPLWLLNTQWKGRDLPGAYVISYVNGDDALHWIPAFNKIVEGYNMLTRDDSGKIEVLFPLASMKKSWFYEALKPLYGLLTWCELPRLKKNCDCPACVRHRHELSVFEGKL